MKCELDGGDSDKDRPPGLHPAEEGEISKSGMEAVSHY
jgi:hypothetical protein